MYHPFLYLQSQKNFYVSVYILASVLLASYSLSYIIVVFACIFVVALWGYESTWNFRFCGWDFFYFVDQSITCKSATRFLWYLIFWSHNIFRTLAYAFATRTFLDVFLHLSFSPSFFISVLDYKNNKAQYLKIKLFNRSCLHQKM